MNVFVYNRINRIGKDVANLTAEPNEKAVEIFEQGIKAETE